MNIALPSGGPVAMMYGLVVAVIGTLAAAMSLAELASIYPTNGAQYEWTAALASPKYQRPVSYVCGWVVTASWWALAAVGPSLLATLVIALIQLLNEGYVFRKWHQFLVFSATEITAGLINAFGTPLLPLLGKGACALSFVTEHKGVWLRISCQFSYQSSGSQQFPLWWLLSPQADTKVQGMRVISFLMISEANVRLSFVFTALLNQTGWNDGTAWLLGLLQGGLSFTAFDA